MALAWGLSPLLAAAPCTAQQEMGRAPHAWMHALLERTFLRIDVLTLDLCLDSATAMRVATHVPHTGHQVDDSIALAVLDAHAVLARLHFLRNVSYGQFLGGIADEQSNAVRAGLLDDSTHVAVRARLPEWFSFLENRDIRAGDELVYQITGDTVRTVYIDADGVVLMERADTGRARRRSVLATWLARGSSFRDPLMKSVRQGLDPGAACGPAPAGNPMPARTARRVRPEPERGLRTPAP
jgi:hypothetical protein